MIVVPKLPPNTRGNTFNTRITGRLLRFEATVPGLQNWIPTPPISDIADVTILRPLKIIEDRLPVLLPYFAVLSVQVDWNSRLA